MLYDYLAAGFAVALLLVVWVAVERAWRRVFADLDPGEASVSRGCRGCLVCARRCAREQRGDGSADIHDPDSNESH